MTSVFTVYSVLDNREAVRVITAERPLSENDVVVLKNAAAHAVRIAI